MEHCLSSVGNSVKDSVGQYKEIKLYENGKSD
jgi:hypothetical protein